MSLFVEENDIQRKDNNEIPVVFDEEDVIPVFPEREINCSLPLRFQQDILKTMLTKDGLLILGHGLGWDAIIANLLHALNTPFVNFGTNIKKKPLIFVLNASESELERLKEELMDLAGGEEHELTIIDKNSPSYRRLKIYAEGGIISVSGQSMISDILSFMIDPNSITGLVVFHAENVKEFSNTAFLIRVFRDRNKWGFIKAFSDKPESFGGFTPLASKLKILKLSNVFLWPRFHLKILESFNIRNKKDTVGKLVTEVKVGLTESMKKLQTHITASIEGCLRELKRRNSTLDTEYWSIENIYDDDFAIKIEASLRNDWHRITPLSKSLVKSIEFLVGLLVKLLVFDSIEIYSLVNEKIEKDLKLQRTQNRSENPWLMSDEAGWIKSAAAERVFGMVRGSYNLEELPKWNELGKLVKDILAEKEKHQEKKHGPILIVCKYRYIAGQISALLSSMQEKQASGRRGFTFRKFMIEKLRDYVDYRENISPRIKQLSEALEGKNTSGEQNNVDTANAEPSLALLRNGAPISKRRRTRGGSVAAANTQVRLQKSQEPTEVDKETLERIEAEYDEEYTEMSLGDNTSMVNFRNEEEEMTENGFEFEHIDKEEQIIVQSFSDTSNTAILQELNPSHIIMYEHDLSFLRRIEIYQAINRDNPADVYLMYYRDSVEEQKHLVRIKKEKEAFNRLIKEKATLPKRFDTESDNAKFQIHKRDVVNTRIAGGASFRTEADDMKVIVDSREFGSDTPFLIYLTGMTVVPGMLTVGDYILSPTMCVERKSVPDLIDSFKNGRLFAQCKKMFKYYKFPVLLIEFANIESFSLQPVTDYKFRKGTKQDDDKDNTLKHQYQTPVQENLVKLLYEFPKLQVIWSASPQESAQIFLELKANQEEPNVAEALDKGVNKSIATVDGSPAVYNEGSIDFIRRIPGITIHNYEKLIQQVKNIEELVCLSEQEFQKILGKENGRKAYNFINRDASA